MYIKRYIQRIISVIFLSSIAGQLMFSQEISKISPYIQLQYFKDNEGQRTLKTTLTYSKNRMELPIPGMNILFYSGSKNLKEIGAIITDEKGVAILQLKDISLLPAEKNGSWYFNTEYKGNDTIEGGSSELTIIDINFKMELAEVDSIKSVILTASKKRSGNDVPLSGEVINVYVPRMFSLLSIGEVTLDNNGSGSLEFPSDLPADKEGNITVIAKIEEHPDFGNVEKRATINWGTKSKFTDQTRHRALWTKTAPKWMVYTLTILLSGVWAHYIYTFICLIRIKKDAKRQRKEKKYETVDRFAQ